MSRSPERVVTERLSAYLDGELAPAEAAAVERELAGDGELRAALDAMRRMSSRLDVDEVDRRAAGRIRAELRSRIRGAGAVRRLPPWRLPAARVWLPLAAAAVAIAAVLVLTLPAGRQPARAVREDAVAEQYTLALDALSQGQP